MAHKASNPTKLSNKGLMQRWDPLARSLESPRKCRYSKPTNGSFSYILVDSKGVEEGEVQTVSTKSFNKKMHKNLPLLVQKKSVERRPTIVMDDAELEEIKDLFQLTREINELIGYGENPLDEFSAPRVIVAGMTSAGKSSLLERIIGRKIFPRAANVCTTRPIQVSLVHDPNMGQDQMIRVKDGEKLPEEFKVQGEEGMSKVMDRIQKSFQSPESLDFSGEPEGETETDVQFNNIVLEVEVRSSQVVNFNVLDLPGAYVRTELRLEQTKAMIKKYFQLPNTIVLYVQSARNYTEANELLASWLEGFATEMQEEKEMDDSKPHPPPVLGVWTKLDVATKEEKAEVAPYLAGKRAGHLGGANEWLAVVSSDEVLESSDPDAAERKFLTKEGVPGKRQGKNALIRALKCHLATAMVDYFPNIEATVGEKIKTLEEKKQRFHQRELLQDEKEMWRNFDSKVRALHIPMEKAIAGQGVQFRFEQAVEKFEENLDAASNFTQYYEEEEIAKEVKRVARIAKTQRGGGFDDGKAFFERKMPALSVYAEHCHQLGRDMHEIVSSAIIKQALPDAFAHLTMEKSNVQMNQIQAAIKESFKANLDHVIEQMDSILKILQSSVCRHPLWLNFNKLHSGFLDKNGHYNPESDAPHMLEGMLKLPQLQRQIETIGDDCIRMYNAHENAAPGLEYFEEVLVRRHFVRVMVWDYIMRSTLCSVIYPMLYNGLVESLTNTKDWPWESSKLFAALVKLIGSESFLGAGAISREDKENMENDMAQLEKWLAIKGKLDGNKKALDKLKLT